MFRSNLSTSTVLLALATGGLYSFFLYSPLVFDDVYLFLAGEPEKYLDRGLQLSPRWIPYVTLVLTYVHLGPELIWLRLGNVILHILVGLALFIFMRRMILDLDSQRNEGMGPVWAAALATLFFLLHPVTVYAAGYLIQRTILLATLFSLLTCLAFWQGLKGSRIVLWSSSLLYVLAVYSKEHAVMVPVVCLGLGVLYRRSGLQVRPARTELAALFGIFALTALIVTYQVKYVVGSVYEPAAAGMLQVAALNVPVDLAYSLSVLTQAGLFFKYLFLWTLPNVNRMSVDMREPFALVLSGPGLAGLLLFITYPIASMSLLWQGGRRGLVGFALLAPWLLFVTEIATVRLQEIFVLYRSYLWMPLVFLLVAMGLVRLKKKLAFALAAILLVFLFALSYDRLYSFSHPFLLWDEAARVAEQNAGKPGVVGLERIYHNRGLALFREGFLPNAVQDYDKAIELRPDYSYVYNDRGAAKLDMKDALGALDDFDTAIRLNPTYLRPYAGRAMALENLNRNKEAQKAHQLACSAGWIPSCSRAQQAELVSDHGYGLSRPPGLGSEEGR